MGVLKLTCATKPIKNPLLGCCVEVDQLLDDYSWLLGTIEQSSCGIIKTESVQNEMETAVSRKALLGDSRGPTAI